ncbi:nucleoside-diphosphate sugar epimerase [Robertkochia solimangrovi]|uniref:nucleoside-diphosphate sugar epimerase n=1 Tax=Robertkochia solimangrovi TaxID=2213046 RepID=UPI00117CFE3F|nr:nucleoside-diphosphate sugar epimerase [Robertkochia solimangrovi]TRZ46409.1 nucleoside-diphosphate sugar epimerase [Robertkochia solimangrovi]
MNHEGDTHKKTAIILGATGLTGQELLHLLLKDDRYEKLILFSRKSIGLRYPKIEEYLIDLFKLNLYRDHFKADEVFCCIGTTRKKTPDLDLYRKIDLGIPFAAARLSKSNEIPVFSVISAIGANTESRIFYNRIKGEMEKKVISMQIPHTFILRPSLITGNRKEVRTAEWISKLAMSLLNPLMAGPLKKYRSVSPEAIARTMISLSNDPIDKQIIENDEILQIGKIN